MSKFKTEEEIDLLRVSGKRLARVLHLVAGEIKLGVTTKYLDEVAERLIRETGDIPPFLNYQPHGARRPFPASLCVSVNDEIVHGIPGDRVIKDGDIVSIDLGLAHKGMITDAALTIPVGTIPPKVLTLVRETERSLEEGIRAMKVGGRIGDIGAAVEKVAHQHGYGVVRELGGHGVGHAVHEDPYVPNYGTKGTGPLLKSGMVLALEPMFMLGSEEIRLMPDGYTIVTEDGSLSAHFEHTVAITDNGIEVLTQYEA
jgi:methionyl aminopeptidase